MLKKNASIRLGGEGMDFFLVKKAQKGEKEAFVELIEKYKVSFYKAAKSYLTNEEDIADVIQDTILSAYEHIGSLRSGGYFKTWLTRILINNCKNLLKERQRYLASDWTEEVIPAPEGDRGFYELLEELPEEDRALFLLYYGEGFRIREIAEILEINENTVKSRLQRGRKKLEKILCC